MHSHYLLLYVMQDGPLFHASFTEIRLSQDSSISNVTAYGLDDQGSLRHHSQIGYGVHPTFYFNVYRRVFPHADYSLSCRPNVEVKDAWRFIFTPSVLFHDVLLRSGGNFSFPFKTPTHKTCPRYQQVSKYAQNNNAGAFTVINSWTRTLMFSDMRNDIEQVERTSKGLRYKIW
jgi:hypothetical protein